MMAVHEEEGPEASRSPSVQNLRDLRLQAICVPLQPSSPLDPGGSAASAVPKLASRHLDPGRAAASAVPPKVASRHGHGGATPSPAPARQRAAAAAAAAAPPPITADGKWDLVLATLSEDRRKIMECLATWQQQLSKQLQEHQLAFEDTVRNQQRSQQGEEGSSTGHGKARCGEEEERATREGVATEPPPQEPEASSRDEQPPRHGRGAAAAHICDTEKLGGLLKHHLLLQEERLRAQWAEQAGQKEGAPQGGQSESATQPQPKQRVQRQRVSFARRRSTVSAPRKSGISRDSGDSDRSVVRPTVSNISDKSPMLRGPPVLLAMSEYQGSPFTGDWVDHQGKFCSGAVIEITEAGWGPKGEADDETSDAEYTVTRLSRKNWQLHITTMGHKQDHYDLKPGPSDTLLIRGVDRKYVLHPADGQTFRNRFRQLGSASARSANASAVEPHRWHSDDDVDLCPWLRPGRIGCCRRQRRPVVKKPSATTRLGKVAKSKALEVLRIALIILDSCFLIWSTERASRMATAYPASAAKGIGDSLPLIICQDFFCLYFVGDLAVRLRAEGMAFFVDHTFWSCFEIFSSVSFVLEVFAHHLFFDQRSFSSFRSFISQVSMLRLLRLFHIGQIATIFNRSSMFRELRLMLYALEGVMKSLLWSGIMVLVILSIFGVILTEGTLSHCIINEALMEENTLDLRTNFGTYSSAMLSLGMAMSGGVDWGEVYTSLMPLHSGYRMVFLTFQAFTFLALLNVVTAVFVESTTQRSRNDKEAVIFEEMMARDEFFKNVDELFQEFDTNGDGELSFQELENNVKLPSVSAYFASLGVAPHEVWRLFDLMDRDGSGTIDKAEFMYGCWHLKGEAKSLDIAIMQADIQAVMTGIADLADDLEGWLLQLDDAPFDA